MDALQLLTSRRSEKKLIAPAPTSEELEQMFQAALQVPDHGHLQPYRFIVIENEGLERLEKLLKDVVFEFDLGEERIRKAENLAKRAPMVIGVVAKIRRDIEKVPAWEQMLTAGCSTYALQLASNALGYANVWISGKWVDGAELRSAFNCENSDKVIGLLMIGTAEEKIIRERKQLDTSHFVTYL